MLLRLLILIVLTTTNTKHATNAITTTNTTTTTTTTNTTNTTNITNTTNTIPSRGFESLSGASVANRDCESRFRIAIWSRRFRIVSIVVVVVAV